MIVADTGPLNYLVRLQCAEILPALFGQVYIPYEIQQELRDGRAPAEVRDWIAAPPAWLTILKPGPRVIAGGGLHVGELAAIELAARLGGQTLLLTTNAGKKRHFGEACP